MKTLSTSATSRFAAWVALFLLFYLSYRYPLQISFSGTSQAYADTPLALQLPKFLVGLFACAFLLWVGRPIAFPGSALAYVAPMCGLAAFAIVKTIVTAEGGFQDFAFWLLVALIVTLHLAPVGTDRLNRVIGLIFYLSFAIDIIQIVLFFTTGRLPALAWEGTFSVRFGSFLDDPNGFSALCYLFLGWAATDPSRWRRRLHVMMVVLMILAAQSLTAVVFLAALAALWLCLLPLRFRGYTIVAVTLGLLAAAAALYGLFIDAIRVLIDFKQGSIDDHSSFANAQLFSHTPLELLLGSSSYQFSESWWIQAYNNFGVPWMACQIVLASYALYIAVARARRATDAQTMRLYSAVAMFEIYFVFGASNLPFYSVFPLNFVYHVICFSMLLNRIHAPARPDDAGAV